MTSQPSYHADSLLATLQKLLRAQPDNVPAICRIGAELLAAGRLDDARKCYRPAVAALHAAARAGDVTRALGCEAQIYQTFVKANEEEQHYYRCFADWKDALAALGRRFRDPAALAEGGAEGIAFLLQTGVVLGHTEVLLKLLEARPRDGPSRVEPRIYVLEQFEQPFLDRCRAIGVEVVLANRELAAGAGATWEGRFLWARERFRRDGIGVCVWVSVPTMVAFAYSMRLAPVQVFWALRFHPVAGPYIDGYISYGARHERERKYGNQTWRVCPPPLTVEFEPPDRAAVAAARSAFPEPVLTGTIAREEKINHAPYLECVARVLKANPHAGFLWTGRAEHPAVSAFFRAQGVAGRCHFAGWVDVNLYANVLDVFLETFPLGGGISGHCALACAVPVVSRLGPYTIFGNHLWHAHAGGPAAAIDPSSPLASEYILCARDDDEYVARANRLVNEPDYRQAVGRAGKAFFDGEAASGPDYARRFFEALRDIAAEKSAARATAP